MVAKAHPGDGDRRAAVPDRRGRGDLVLLAQMLDQAEIGHEGRVVRQGQLAVRQRHRQEIDLPSRPVQRRADNQISLTNLDGKRDQRRRHVQIPEGTRHRIFSADRRHLAGQLGPEGAQEGAQGLSPVLVGR